MKVLTGFLSIFLVMSYCNTKKIKHVYFDPQTTMTESKQDGVIILETMTGIKSTICLNVDNANKNADVICRMMGYEVKIGKQNSLAIISSKKSVFSNGTHFQNIKCNGNERSLTECSGYKYYEKVEFKCTDHNQDLHVICLGEFKFSNVTISPTKSNCSASGLKIASLSNKSHGLLKIRNGTQEFTVCGINRNFGVNEAQLFCKELLCEQSSYARIIEGYSAADTEIGGFRNMKCPSNAKSLSDCQNVYPYDNKGCTPSDNIGVLCSSDPDIPDADPQVYCNETSLSLFWDKSKHPEIKPMYVSIIKSDKPCDDVFVDDSVKLTVNYPSCGMIKEGEKETIIYSFKAKRIYPKINDNIIVKNDQIYHVSCLIPRNDSTTIASFSISSEASLPLIATNTPIPTTMIVSTNSKFQPSLLNIKDVNIGSEIFIRVTLIQPPSQLVPFLDSCYVESGTIREPLILNKCPSRSDVIISPLDNVTILFSFKSFAIGNTAKSAFIKCNTSICGRQSAGCIPTCQQNSAI